MAKRTVNRPAAVRPRDTDRSASPLHPKVSPAAEPNFIVRSSIARVSAEARRAMIAEAAYYIAESRGFGAGRELEDWLSAECRIDAVLADEPGRPGRTRQETVEPAGASATEGKPSR